MTRYFNIQSGLRGCYMPDSGYVLACSTRRELRAAIESEARAFADSGFKGASQKAISALAAAVWADAGKPRPSVYPFTLTLAQPGGDGSYNHGIFASVATKADWLACQEICE